MFAGLTLVTPPAAEPVTVADAKSHSRILTNLDDSLLAGYISSARMTCENSLKRALLPQQWRYALQHWPGRSNSSGYRNFSTDHDRDRAAYIQIPLPPLVSVDVFTYMDTQGNVLNMTQGYGNQVGNYLLDLDHEPGRVALPFSGIWPTTILLPTSPIQITFTAGFPLFTGTASIDINGVATAATGTFDKRMAGTWLDIGGVSYNVLSFTDPTHLQLAAPPTGATSTSPFTSNAVPMPIRHAILFLAAHFYENRETVITGRGEVAVEIPGTVDDLLAPYRDFTRY